MNKTVTDFGVYIPIYPLLYAPAVCGSVCLSVTFVHCIQTAEHIVKLLSRCDSPNILVFLTPSADTNYVTARYKLADLFFFHQHKAAGVKTIIIVTIVI